MAVQMSLGGNSAGDGFLVAPLGANYDAELSLSTDAGTLAVTLQASPDAAGLVFSQTNLTLSTTPTIVNVHATLQSTSREDTTIRVLDAAAMEVASFTVTSIKHPAVNFKGRFEARFATAGASPFTNVQYTPMTVGNAGPGWTWGLEGEPAFVPAVGAVPENLETTGVGRVVRLNNPVALRSHAAPVVSIVDSVTGDTTLGPETFLAGDPVIGQPVDFGPDTYFAGNQPSGTPAPEEFYTDAEEPMGLFEFHVGSLFSGASEVGPFVAKATMIDQKTRTPDSRPIAEGLELLGTELADFGLPSLQAFSEARIGLLVADYNNPMLLEGTAGTLERRNVARRIGHLLLSVGAATFNQVQNNPPGLGPFTVLTPATLTLGWNRKEVFKGKVDENLVFTPGASAVVNHMSQFNSFNITWEPFAFHSDELCGHHKGTLTHLNPDGSYSGDPHTRTVDGTFYDFQGVGEFTLLRYGNRMEIQARQTPVATQNPITDSYTGLTACVSINTAIAARLGSHRISLQPVREERRLQLYVDGKPASLSTEGIDLGGHRVTPFDANGEMGVRADYEDGTVLLITPAFWSSHNVWYMNVSVSNTRADEGIMGYVPKDSWLPRLRTGESLGPMPGVGQMPPSPTSLHDRYVVLYKKFADSWRVTDQTSLFVYEPGTSTKTFTDPDWPAEKPPCKLKPELQIPGAPILKGMTVAEAARICRGVKIKDLHNNCIFDVATTGDETFAEGYLLAQELRLSSTRVQLTAGEPASRQPGVPDETGDQGPVRPVRLTATVLPMTQARPTPTGGVTFFVDGVPMNRPAQLDDRGRARVTLRLKPGEHRIRATYSGTLAPRVVRGGKDDHHASSSANVLYTVGTKEAG